MSQQATCPQCASEYGYQDGNLWVCPMCANEWSTTTSPQATGSEPESLVVRDANGNVLQEGDSVTVIKDLKIKGSSSVVKVGTKVKNIHLVESSDGHNIDCRIDGIGNMGLKSEFVKKS